MLNTYSYPENLTFSKTFIDLTVIETVDFYVALRFVQIGVKFLRNFSWDNYTLPTCDLPLILYVHPWFKFWHFAHL